MKFLCSLECSNFPIFLKKNRKNRYFSLHWQGARKENFENRQKLLNWRAQIITRETKLPKIAKNSPSWRGQKIPSQAKICDIAKNLPSWKGQKKPQAKILDIAKNAESEGTNNYARNKLRKIAKKLSSWRGQKYPPMRKFVISLKPRRVGGDKTPPPK